MLQFRNNFEQQKLLKKLVKEELIEIKHEEPKDSFSAIIMLGMLGSGILPEQYLVGTDKGNQYIFKIDFQYPGSILTIKAEIIDCINRHKKLNHLHHLINGVS